MSTIKIGTIINGAEALQCYRDGIGKRDAWPPEIPAGCNTNWSRFHDAEKRPALVIRQSGFKRERGEGEVNGISVVIALDAEGEEAFAALEAFVAKFLEVR